MVTPFVMVIGLVAPMGIAPVGIASAMIVLSDLARLLGRLLDPLGSGGQGLAG
jgi:hypothetical protein